MIAYRGSGREPHNAYPWSSLNFKIYKAYQDLSKNKKKVKITDILNKIQDRRKDSLDVHKYLKRILTLAYYLNWNLEKDSNDLESDSFVKISNTFLHKLTQRFNFDIVGAIYENNDCFIFLNSRNKLNLVFKNLDNFEKKDVEKIVIPTLKKVFKLKKVNLDSNL